jgi:hypothetical protein
MRNLTMRRSAVGLLLGLVATACGGGETADSPAATDAPAVTTGSPPVATEPGGPSGTTAAPPSTVPPPTAPPSTPAPPALTTSPPSPTTEPPPPPTTEPGPLLISINVYDGIAEGDEHLVIERGTTIELVVTSDVADEIHVHGYDYKADVEAGGTATITFVADLPGIYEVELEDSRLLLIELEIR